MSKKPSSPLGFSGLLAELLDEQDAASAAKTASNADNATLQEEEEGDWPALDADCEIILPPQPKLTTPLGIAPVGIALVGITPVGIAPARIAPMGTSVESDLDGLLDGLVDEESVENAEARRAAYEQTLDGRLGVHNVSLAMPEPWDIQAATETAATVSLALDANKEFRPYMEDGHVILDPLLTGTSGSSGSGSGDTWSFFAVYDGHGGRNECGYCETHLHEIVSTELEHALAAGQTARHALERSFLKIDGQLAMLGAWNSGCTATVALLQRQPGARKTLHLANVGDSRAVLLGVSQARRLSKDHVGKDPSETARIEAGGGRVRNGRVSGKLMVSRSLGDHELKNSGVIALPDICTLDVLCGHAVVIASDGLWDAVSDDDAREVVEGCIHRAVENGDDQELLKASLRERAAQELVDRAKERGSRDNILVLVIFI